MGAGSVLDTCDIERVDCISIVLHISLRHLPTRHQSMQIFDEHFIHFYSTVCREGCKRLEMVQAHVIDKRRNEPLFSALKHITILGIVLKQIRTSNACMQK